MKKRVVQDTLVSLSKVNDDDCISLTDIARVRNPDEPKDVVTNWLRNRATVECLGLWEKINNTAFKGVEFDSFKLQAGSNSFALAETIAAWTGCAWFQFCRSGFNPTRSPMKPFVGRKSDRRQLKIAENCRKSNQMNVGANQHVI